MLVSVDGTESEITTVPIRAGGCVADGWKRKPAAVSLRLLLIAICINAVHCAITRRFA